MNDTAILLIFIFFMVSNFLLSIFYAVGTKQMRAAVKKNNSRKDPRF